MMSVYALLSIIVPAAALTTRKDGTGCPHPSSPPYITPTTTAARTCTSTGTQTWLAKTGCAIQCSQTATCIADNVVTLPCGCNTVHIVTTDITVCPTATPCVECSTGFGFWTVAESPCSNAATPSTPPY